MDSDEIIEKILNEIHKEKFISIDKVIHTYGNPNNNEDIMFLENLLRQLINRNIIETPNRINYRLMPLGEEIVESYGGWLKYKLKQEIIGKKKEKKEELDLKLANWQVKTFWWLFGLAIFGGICGIISLVMQLVK